MDYYRLIGRRSFADNQEALNEGEVAIRLELAFLVPIHDVLIALTTDTPGTKIEVAEKRQVLLRYLLRKLSRSSG